jgi:hypothetical protein
MSSDHSQQASQQMPDFEKAELDDEKGYYHS